MKKNDHHLIYKSSATLCDGTSRLQGCLELWNTEIYFRLNDFKESHLNLIIPLKGIEKVEEYLVFDLAKNGLRIQDEEGRYDLFVLEDVRTFKQILIKTMGIK